MPTITVPGPAPESERGAYFADPVATAIVQRPWPGVVVIHDASDWATTCASSATGWPPPATSR